MSGSPGDIHPADRVALRVILAVGLVAGLGLTAMGVFTAITRVLDPARYPVSVLADVPVPLSGGDVIDAQADSVLVHTSGLSPEAVWLLASGDLVGALTLGAVTMSFCVVLWRVVQHQPFHRHMYTAALVAGCSIALGSLLSQGLGGLGQLMAAAELSDALGGVARPGFLFTPLPVVAGLGVLALAYVFRAGNRLQRDTEGLV
ncbi:hypothetical protein [Microbacterium trichothecenolyticum]|nr:hypothetical protein [Microbacterium trichothecenolyticum]